MRRQILYLRTITHNHTCYYSSLEKFCSNTARQWKFSKIPTLVRNVQGWYEKSVVRTVRKIQGWYEKSMVRNVHGTKSPQMVRNVYGTNGLWYEKSGNPLG